VVRMDDQGDGADTGVPTGDWLLRDCVAGTDAELVTAWGLRMLVVGGMSIGSINVS
jgi:hypothetical protein